MTMPIFAQPVSASSSQPASVSSGARLVASDGRALPLERTELVCDASGGIARSVLQQTFRNDGNVPLEVTYLLPLPSDGAVSGYSFTLEGVTTRGKVEPARLARERYEEALMEGKSAALLEQDRSSVFRQAIGNIPPGARIELEVLVDHPLTWTDSGWELRFPTVVAPRYQSGSESSATVSVVVPSETFVAAAHSVTVVVGDALTGAPRSPSHALSVTEGEQTTVRILDARLDRDVVVRWPVASANVGARLETARLKAENPTSTAQYGLLTLVPPRATPRAVPRDLIVLIDTSGSMAGEPLAQAVHVVTALVQSLHEQDRLELIEFGTTARRWRSESTPATPEHKRQALAWLQALRAGGGTEMRSGIEAALATLRPGALRQVILVSDGLIGFEQQVLRRLIEKLPPSCRFHSVGVGHATNGSLLQPAARAGRGACIVVAPGEDVEPACARLLARTAQPLVVSLSIAGTALAEAPVRLLDLYSGAPALVPLALKAEGGDLEIRGETPDGAFTQRLVVEPREAGYGNAKLAALYARERVEDWELRLAAHPNELQRVDAEIEKLGVDFQIASRVTSWVAVSEEVTVDGTRGSRRVEQPQLLPAGISAEGLGLRTTTFFGAVAGAPAMARAPMAASPMRMRVGAALPPAPAAPAPAPPANRLEEEPGPTRTRAGSTPAARGGRGLGDFFRGIKDAIMGPPAAPPPAAASSGTLREEFGTPPTERVKGRIRLNSEKRLAVAIEAADRMDWQLPEVVRAELADGTFIDLKVEKQHSTPSGIVQVGLEVRLVCSLEAKLPADAVRIHIEYQDVPGWIVELGG